MRLKICDSHLTCEVANKCLNVHEQNKREWNKRWWNKRWSPPFPCCRVSRQCLWKKILIEKKIIPRIKKKIMKEISLSMNEHYQCRHQRFCNVCNFSSNERNYSLFIKGFMNLILKKIITAVTFNICVSY